MNHRAALVASVAFVVLAIAFVPAALAGKGSHGNGGTTTGTSTLSLAVPLWVDLNGNNLPNWGDTVTFNVSTTATTEPFLELDCSQNGVVVYGANTGYFDSYTWPWTKYMKLGSQMWTGGDAACTATLFMFVGGKQKTLATLNFTAYA